MKSVFLLRFLFMLFILCGWCFVSACFRQKETPPDTYRIMVSEVADQKIADSREIAAAIFSGSKNSGEIAVLNQFAQQNDLKIKIRFIPVRNDLPALLRSGRYDVIAGKFTKEELLRWHLIPGFAYSLPNETKQFFLGMKRGSSFFRGTPIRKTMPPKETANDKTMDQKQ
ncbi:MAG: hypothetical protein J6W81_02050 [Lentisphaeria bacterium]|nr:hypothetical protein [Lentisphaeria bacterium]